MHGESRQILYLWTLLWFTVTECYYIVISIWITYWDLKFYTGIIGYCHLLRLYSMNKRMLNGHAIYLQVHAQESEDNIYIDTVGSLDIIIIMCRPWTEWWKRLIQIYAKQFYPSWAAGFHLVLGPGLSQCCPDRMLEWP